MNLVTKMIVYGLEDRGSILVRGGNFPFSLFKICVYV